MTAWKVALSAGQSLEKTDEVTTIKLMLRNKGYQQKQLTCRNTPLANKLCFLAVITK